MLAIAPVLLALAATANAKWSVVHEASALAARAEYGNCDSKCTTFDEYYSACTSNATGEKCLAVCTVSEFTVYQACLNCIEQDQAGVSFKSTLEKVRQRCIDNSKGDPTNGAGITSMAIAKNSTGSANSTSEHGSSSNTTNPHTSAVSNPHGSATSGAPASGTSSAAASSSSAAKSGASAATKLSAAGVLGAVAVGAAMLL